VNKGVKLFDTLLRDGEQSNKISLTVDDKLKIVTLIDDFGIQYIEVGWPGTNPQVDTLFEKLKIKKLKNSKIVAFGSTKKHSIPVNEDKNLNDIKNSGATVACIFGKSWDFHVKDALGISLEDNLNLIQESIEYLKKHMKEVFFDAEHFFDAYKNNQEYAMLVLKTAVNAGVDTLVLADTNGGTLPFEVTNIIKAVQKEIKIPLGVHMHNDSDCAVANTLEAVNLGISHIQGTINGYGERIGNANLCSIIPALKLKMSIDCISDKSLSNITNLSKSINKILNLPDNDFSPYVGENAFLHKGGIHVSAILKDSKMYEHIQPKEVGNHQNIVVSIQSGISNIIFKAKAIGISISQKDKEIKNLIHKIKELENIGYNFSKGETSFNLLLIDTYTNKLSGCNAIDFSITNTSKDSSEFNVLANVNVEINGKVYSGEENGSGLVSAFLGAFKNALINDFQILEKYAIIDYEVEALNQKSGLEQNVRVTIEATNGSSKWKTVSADNNIANAIYKSIYDSLIYMIKIKG